MGVEEIGFDILRCKAGLGEKVKTLNQGIRCDEDLNYELSNSVILCQSSIRDQIRSDQIRSDLLKMSNKLFLRYLFI
jgi:hypothetical protein